MEAFERLENEYQSQLLRITIRLTENVNEAEEVYAESRIKALLAFNTLIDPVNAFLAWRVRIIFNVWIDEIRRRNKFVAISLDGLSTEDDLKYDYLELADAGIDIEARFINQESQINFWLTAFQALAGVSKESRQCFKLRYIHQYSYQQIATILNCPLGTVKSRLGRAYKAIRKAVAEQP